MILRINKDARGQTEYSIEDDKGIRVVSETLARYRVKNGDISNAYVDDTGVIRLNEDLDRRGVFGVKSDVRIKQEREAIQIVGDTKYRIVATVKEGEKLKGYVLRDVLKMTDIRIPVSKALVYTSIGAIVNAKLDYKSDGTEYIVGVGLNINNLAVIDLKTGKSENVVQEQSVRVADGVGDVMWKDIVALKADTTP